MPVFSRRKLLVTSGASLLAAPAIAQDLDFEVQDQTISTVTRRNTSSFQQQSWQDHFERLGVATIVCDTGSRALHFWNEDGTDYRIYPTSVPMSEELTRRGYTEIVRKKEGPTWTPTANMRERDPSLPEFMPAGPGNPLGTHAMYLSWPAYLIHGTHDTRKIGRQSSSGCIGLYNEKIEELYALCPIGTQVRVI